MSDDLHTSTTAGPTPQPSPTVGSADSTREHPAGTAPPPGDGGGDSALKDKASQVTDKASQFSDTAQKTVDERPEVLVGAAFAGGLVAAIILKRLGHG